MLQQRELVWLATASSFCRVGYLPLMLRPSSAEPMAGIIRMRLNPQWGWARPLDQPGLCQGTSGQTPPS